MSESTLSVALVYPELLGLYGDRGNALTLLHRAGARGIDAQLIAVAAGEPVPAEADIYLLGGGEDAAMVVAGELIMQQRGLISALADGRTALAVCAGFQLLSEEYAGPDGVRRPGLGILDARCGRLPNRRAVGEVLCEPVDHEWGLLTGFENHQGDAVLGPAATPLGRVLRGVGNGHDGAEGAVCGGVIATYLHGPVLARNPDLADHLLARALGVDRLTPFEEPVVERLRRERTRRRWWPFGQ